MGIAVDHRSDLYSLGCVMYETLTGAPPLMGDSALSTMMKHQSEKPLSLKEASLGIEYPPQLEALVAKLLEKDPADRYQDASTLTAELVSLEQQFKEGGGRTFAPIANVSDSKSTGVAGGAQFNWLGIAAGFAIGLATGYLLARPHTVVVEQQAPKINLGILDSKIHKDLNHYKIPDAEVNDLKPFSVISDNNVRIFHFPKSVIGALSLKTNEIMAKNVIPISDFQPFWFKGNEVLWNQPELLKRFRKDEIKTINFDDCEINLEKLLTYAADITSIADIQLNDTDITDKTLPIIDKFPNLTGLSLKRTNISAEGLLKLKRFKKIRYLNVDNCRNMKPLLKQMKEMPDLYSLGLSRIELNSQDVDELIKNKNVHGLVISGNPNIDDELIKKFVHMKRLENISIVDCNVTGKSIQTFKKFPALKAISLPDWKPEVMERFRTELPYVLIAGSKLRNRQAERMYEEDMKKQGKSKSGYGADL